MLLGWKCTYDLPIKTGHVWGLHRPTPQARCTTWHAHSKRERGTFCPPVCWKRMSGPPGPVDSRLMKAPTPCAHLEHNLQPLQVSWYAIHIYSAFHPLYKWLLEILGFLD